MVVVYIASPYTKGDTGENVKAQLDAADELMNHGFCPVVPLFTHFQHIHRPRPYEDWMKIDLAKLERCDCLLRLPGESAGADREVLFAKENGIRVFDTFFELLEEYK